jgi:hypothetical protein
MRKTRVAVDIEIHRYELEGAVVRTLIAELSDRFSM